MGLIIHHGSPKWWLSPDIWVTPVGATKTSAPGVAHPIATDPYDVWVQVSNPTSTAVTELDYWNLNIVWAVPTVGPIPLSATTPLNETGISVPAKSSKVVKATSVWTPSFVNGGHECLVAFTWNSAVGDPFASLDGDEPATDYSSIAQRNLGVVELGKKRSFQYSFQVCNSAREQLGFVVAAEQAPLSEVEWFMPSLATTKPGTVQNLGLVASAQPDPSEPNAANPVNVTVGPNSCIGLSLVGTLDAGAALIHVTQTINQQTVGGLSVVVLAD
jgi:hypothetical protein